MLQRRYSLVTRPQGRIAFATFGPQSVLTRLATAAQLALQASWHAKWVVHRRLRPEEFGGRVHNHLTGKAEYPLQRELLESSVVARLGERGHGWLLPQAYPEGCPAQRSYLPPPSSDQRHSSRRDVLSFPSESYK